MLNRQLWSRVLCIKKFLIFLLKGREKESKNGGKLYWS
jgi:hypothetical protein